MNTISQSARVGFLGQLGSTGEKTAGTRPCLPVLGGLFYSLFGVCGLFWAFSWRGVVSYFGVDAVWFVNYFGEGLEGRVSHFGEVFSRVCGHCRKWFSRVCEVFW